MSLTMSIVYTTSGEKPLLIQSNRRSDPKMNFIFLCLRGNNDTTLVDSGRQECPLETTCTTSAVDNCQGSGCTIQSLPSCLVKETFANTDGKVCELPVFN